MRSYDARQLENHQIAMQRRETLRREVPGYADLEDTIASLSVAKGKLLLSGDEGALDSLKESLACLRAQKTALITGAGYPADYLEPVYTCPDCRDTGYIGSQKCHCLRQAIISKLYHQTGIQRSLQENNFSTLRYDFYEGEALSLFEKAVDLCHNFVDTFEREHQNLLLYGTVGCGKSFLSGCVARELIESGHSVLYFSASDFFDLLSRQLFHKQDGHPDISHEDLMTCDLLIIDDLGTELTNQFVESSLFSCLNERQLYHRSVIISTNLSLEDVRNRYSERIFSRMMSHYQLCKMAGPDIRIEKRKETIRK